MPCVCLHGNYGERDPNILQQKDSLGLKNWQIIRYILWQFPNTLKGAKKNPNPEPSKFSHCATLHMAYNIIRKLIKLCFL